MRHRFFIARLRSSSSVGRLRDKLHVLTLTALSQGLRNPWKNIRTQRTSSHIWFVIIRRKSSLLTGEGTYVVLSLCHSFWPLNCPLGWIMFGDVPHDCGIFSEKLLLFQNSWDNHHISDFILYKVCLNGRILLALTARLCQLLLSRTVWTTLVLLHCDFGSRSAFLWSHIGLLWNLQINCVLNLGFDLSYPLIELS